MTAEITVMNKMAIAMAADSAMTITHPNGKKIYNTVNKLFALTKYHPVGIMVYDNAEIMGVPWETVIKIYRKHLGRKRFATIEEYGQHFVEFFQTPNILFPESQQHEHFKTMVEFCFYWLRRQIKEELDEAVKEKGELSEDEIKELVANQIRVRHERVMSAERLDNIPDDVATTLLAKFGADVDEFISSEFEKLPITDDAKTQLREISTGIFLRNEFDFSLSGVVIAGFGEDEIFPSTRAYTFEGIIENRLKHRLDKHRAVSHDMTAYVVPFAQADMVYTFINGVDPNYNQFTMRAGSLMLRRFSEAILQKVEGLDESGKGKLAKLLSETRDDLRKTYSGTLDRHRKDNYTDGVMSAVALLPIDELAAMAEALVNLTVFKHKVSMSTETVGGAVDVAVITKGDGFVWIKRKHYFRPELNPQFFAQMINDEGDGRGRP